MFIVKPLIHTPSNLIKKATEECHQEVENQLIPLLNGINNASDYAHILKSFHGYFTPLEKTIQPYISAKILPDFESRRKSEWLKNDLLALKVDSNIIYAKQLPFIQNTAQAFGALYVMEGSTLGGRYITKMLLKNTSIDLSNAISFFNGYGDETGEKWKFFLNSLNHFSQENSATESIAASATETFKEFKNWILANDKKQ